jgi:thiamine biosynthesis lipoprotein
MFEFSKKQRLYETAPILAMGRGMNLHKLSGHTMGTHYVVNYYSHGVQSDPGLSADIFNAVDKVDKQMSTWDPHSNLSLFNGEKAGRWFEVPEDLAIVVQAGLKISEQSKGAFDVTVGSAVNLWGFGPGLGTGAIPSFRELENLLGKIGLAGLEVRMDPPALRKHADISVDLSGIAKGFGVDQIAEVLERNEIHNYFVSIDGEVRVRGCKNSGGPNGKGPWNIAIEVPKANIREAWDILQPKDIALATSGDYRHYLERDGKRYSHTIDRHNARPVDNDVGSVTVAHHSCMIADAWATALLVLGVQDGVALATELGLAALFLVRNGDSIDDVVTGNFDELIG